MSGRSATATTRSPACAPVPACRASCSTGVKNFAIGDCQPSPVRCHQARPLAPSALATSVRASIFHLFGDRLKTAVDLLSLGSGQHAGAHQGASVGTAPLDVFAPEPDVDRQ